MKNLRVIIINLVINVGSIRKVYCFKENKPWPWLKKQIKWIYHKKS